MITRRKYSLIIILLVTAVFIAASSTLAMAKTDVKKIVYQGSGKATVYFKSSVSYGDAKVITKDSSNKTYSTTIKSKSSTKLQFKIAGYKTGKTYKITVKGLNSGDAVGSFKIYSKSKAAKTAKEKSKASGIKQVKTKSDTYNGYAVWRITFNGRISGITYKFTYLIKQQTGQVMYSKREQA